MGSALKNKKILITAGPTWVPIDKVRVISNISSGATGAAIAQEAKRQGAKVTLLLGPGGLVAGIKIVRFRYFEELQRLLDIEVKRGYDVIIHAAAVSDYMPVKVSSGKIRSGARSLTVRLKGTPKLIAGIRKKAKRAFLVMFKLEAGKSKERLLDSAYRAMLDAGAELVVANNAEDVSETRHKAYIVDLGKKIIAVETKKELAKRLLEVISKKIGESDAETTDCG